MNKYLLSILLAGICGCQQSSEIAAKSAEAPAESAGTSWQDTFNSATEELDNRRKAVQDAAANELDKLVTYEYHIAELDREATTESIEARLGELGKERWDCFHIDPGVKTLRIFCKRAPKTVLKFIPRVF
jgi:hypothetical protein